MTSTRAKPAPIQPGDVHVVINDWESRWEGEAKCYSDKGVLMWTIPALCKGVSGARWEARNGDTPPGLYLAGELFITQDTEAQNIWNAYGKHCIDLIEQEDQERKHDRGGICWHGGGSGAPDPLAPFQPLLATLGCVRSHNSDLANIVVPLLQKLTAQKNRMWITVNQIE